MPATRREAPRTEAPRAQHPATWSDAELLRRVVAREDRAWAELDRRYRPLLYRCIAQVTSRYAPHLGASDIDEIYAELLLKLLRDDMARLRRFDPARGTKLGSWLATIAMRASYDALRRTKRIPSATAHEDELESESHRTPLDALLEKERWHCFGDLLGDLTPRERKFLDLYFGEGLNAPTVATKMAIDLKTVYTKKHKIRAHLRRALRTRAQASPLSDLEERAA